MATQMKEAEIAARLAQAAANRAKNKAPVVPPADKGESSLSSGAQQTTRVSPNRYGDLDELQVGKLSSSKWSDDELRRVHIYRVDRVSAAKCFSLGSRLVTAIENGVVDTTTADICLVLAVSLAKPGINQFEHLLDKIGDDMGYGVVFTQPEIQERGGQLSPVEIAMMQRARDKLATATTEEEQRRYAETIQRLEAREAGAPAPLPIPHEKDAAAYCFLAAFLMKLNGKAEDAFLDSLNMMKLRYSAWYEGESAILRNFNPTLDTIKALRVVFARRPELISTWVMTVAVNENKPNPLSTTQQGLLNYLACQQYSYFGMHAYTLLLSIHETTGLKLGTLLREMDCPNTRSGVRAAYEIIKDHEVTSKNPNRTTYFRYARVWNSKYFSALQSSNCTTLVYVAAKVAKMTSAQKSGGDPMEIYAIRDMDEVVKARLDAVSLKMATMILDSMLIDEQSGSAWRSTS